MKGYISNHWMNTILFYCYDYKKEERERGREKNNEPGEHLVYVTVLMIIITGLNENHIYLYRKNNLKNKQC